MGVKILFSDEKVFCFSRYCGRIGALMTLPKQKFREILLFLLYSFDFVEEIDEDFFSFLMKELSVSKRYVLEAYEIFRDIKTQLSKIDQVIGEHATSYEFKRIPAVECNILRLSVYELLFSKDVPAKVALSEAVRLTRKFATPEGATFVNAVLDSVYHTYHAQLGAKEDELLSLESVQQEQTTQ